MRKIIHIDMDAFFASVEQRNQPALRGQPIAVGGDPKKRGVVATASYEARAFGVHSAMPMATAIKRCPALIVVPSNIAEYRRVAMQIRDIFARFSDLIEPISIDEAYLDVTHNDDFSGSATRVAQAILNTISEETQLTASAGVSYCKFLAKYASNVNKPNGIYTITPANARQIIDQMPIGKFHGIGPATEKKLQQLAIKTGFDLRHASLDALTQLLGKNARFYYELAQGKDNREVRAERIRKSYGSETTFANDLTAPTQLAQELSHLLNTTWTSLAKHQLTPKTLTIKIKYQDFSLHTRRLTEPAGIDSQQSAHIIAQHLLTRQPILQPVRLLGVSFSNFLSTHVAHQTKQLRLFS